MIAVIDYGVANLGSMLNMLRRIGAEPVAVSTPAEVSGAERIILPGIGAFDQGASTLAERGLAEALRQRVLGGGVPLLGVCLGMQLLGQASEEGRQPGLGLIRARSVRFASSPERPLRVPHMGWNTVRFVKPGPLSKNLESESRFYFVHSYHVVCDDKDDVLAVADYGGEFSAMVQRGRVFGAQFHPEKSHRFGMQILRNFLEV